MARSHQVRGQMADREQARPGGRDEVVTSLSHPHTIDASIRLLQPPDPVPLPVVDVDVCRPPPRRHIDVARPARHCMGPGDSLVRELHTAVVVT